MRNKLDNPPPKKARVGKLNCDTAKIDNVANYWPCLEQRRTRSNRIYDIFLDNVATCLHVF